MIGDRRRRNERRPVNCTFPGGRGGFEQSVELTYTDGLARLWVSDNVVGFYPATVLEGEAQSGWRLVGIRDWVQLVGGDCHIESAPDASTTLTVEIPLLAEKERENGAH